MSLIKGIRNYKSKILLIFMLLSGIFMIKNQMDKSKQERKQYFYNYSGELSGDMSFDGNNYSLNTGFVTYEFSSNNCTTYLLEFTSSDKIIKKPKTNHFTILQSDGRRIECR